MGLESGSVRNFMICIAMLFSIVEPPPPPTANGGRAPEKALFVGVAGISGITIAGHMLLTGRLPGPMESGQPGRGSNKAIPCPKTSPRLGTATCAPKTPPMLHVTDTQLHHF